MYLDNLKKNHNIDIPFLDFVKLLSSNLFSALYGGSKEGVTPTQKTSNHGLVDREKYHNIGASTRAKREAGKTASLFELLKGVAGKYSGPVFDFYYENLGADSVETGRIFDPQYAGAKNAGTSITQRSYSDFEKYIKGVGEFMDAVQVIPQGVRATSQDEVNKAEDAFLDKLLASTKTFESYNSPEKRFEIATHGILLWLTMGRAPSGTDLKIWGDLMNMFDKGKSLPELINRWQGVKTPSYWRYDYVGTQNFIWKAYKKGLLPIDLEGKMVEEVEKKLEDNPLLTPFFKRVDDNLAKLQEKVLQEEKEGKKPNTWQNFELGVLEKLRDFGNWRTGLKTIYKDKYNWTAKRLLDATGVTRTKDAAQGGIFFMMFLLGLTVLAIQQGLKELDTK